MKKLVEYIVENITGSKEIVVNTSENDGHTEIEIVAPKELIGLIIGKQGRTINSIRNILKVRAVLEKVSFNLTVTEESN